MHKLWISTFALGVILAGLALTASGLDAGSPDGARKDPTFGHTAQPLSTTWLKPRPVLMPRRDALSRSLGAESVATYLSVNVDPEGDLPRDVVFVPDGTEAVIVNRDTDNLSFFDVVTRTITHSVKVGDYPVSVSVTPDGLYAVTANVLGNTISIVDLVSHTVLAHVPVTGEQPYQVVTTADSQFAIAGVINDGVNSSFSVIDLDLLEETLSFPSAPQGVFGSWSTPEPVLFGNIFTQFAVSPYGSTVVLPDRENGRVLLYEHVTGTEVASFSTAALPTAVDVSSDGALAVVSHEWTSRRITVLNLIQRIVHAVLPTPDDLWGQVIRITPDNRFAIAAPTNRVIFVDIATGVTTASLYTGGVGDIEFSFDGRYAFVSNYNARVIDLDSQSIVGTLSFAPSWEAATSPVEHRAVALNNRFREDIHFYNTNGSAGFVEGKAASGGPPEGDATRAVAVTTDCQTAVAVNNTSDNAAIIDLASRQVVAHVPTGERSLAVALTPDNSHALVTNAGSNTLSIIDLATAANVANLNVPTSPAGVRVSPDSRFAYVASVAGTDRIHFISLDGAASTVTDSLIVGEMGGLTYGNSYFSGIELSPDGSILAVCESFDDRLRLIDTTTHATITTVAVGDFPIRVAFSPDGSRAYITNYQSDDVYLIDVASATRAVVSGIDVPLSISVDQTDTYLYVGSYSFQGSAVKIIDTATESIVATLPLADWLWSTHLSPTDSILSVGTDRPELVRFKAAGPDTVFLDATSLTETPYDMEFCEPTSLAVIAQPIPDGVDLVRLMFFTGDFESGDFSGWSLQMPPP